MTESPSTLLSRKDTGIEVRLDYLPVMDMIVLAVELDGRAAAVTIDPESARDAFEHPMLYLAKAQVEELGVS